MSREPVAPDQGVARCGAAGIFVKIIPVRHAAHRHKDRDEVVVEEPGFDAEIFGRGPFGLISPVGPVSRVERGRGAGREHGEAEPRRPSPDPRHGAPGAYSAASAAPSERALASADSLAISALARAIGFVR